jgi:hypothetical protein
LSGCRGRCSATSCLWRRSTPALAARLNALGLERLFFELYGQALVVRGYSSDQARAEARLEVAVVRGLLLDVLATGNRDETAAAARLFTSGHRQPRPG